MLDLVRKYHVDVLRETARRPDEEGKYRVDAVVDEDQIGVIETNGYTVEVREDIEAVGKARQAEVGQGNRYL
jgi:hypothetical protein